MVILRHIQQGLNIAAESFLTLWEHKKLLLYLLAPVLFNLIFPIYSAYDFVYTLISRGAPTSNLMLIKAMSKAIIADLGIACLSVHIYTILEHQISSVRATIRTVAHRAPLIVSWSLIVGAITYLTLTLFHMIAVPFADMRWVMHGITGIQILLGTLWIATVFFTVQILALEELSLIQSLKLSLTLSRALILEIVGGEFWIGLVWFLSVLPFMIMFEKPMAYQLLNDTAIHEWSWITVYVLIFIGWVCASAQTVFRTKLFYQFYLKPRENEVDALFYPRF